MTRKETIEKLYVLRSMLSVISIETDKLKTQYKEIENINNEKQQCNERIVSNKKNEVYLEDINE